MRTIDLEKMDINSLRKMAKASGLPLNRKADIVNALSDDSPSTTGEVVSTASSWIESALNQVVSKAAPSEDRIKSLIREVLLEDGVPSSNGASTSPVGLVPEDDDTFIRWPDVSPAVCDVNGEYVFPPFYEELKAVSKFSHVELKGPAGSGKTLAVHKLAELSGKNLAVITADGGLRRRDMIGQREMINGTTYFEAGEFASAAKNGDWALIDEVSMAEADALGFLLGMTDRCGSVGSTFTIGGKSVDVHPDFRCFITRNPGYAGTKTMNEALKDRFYTFEVAPLLDDDLTEMLKAHATSKYQRDVFIPQSVPVVSGLYRAWEKNSIAYQISPRRVLVAMQLANALGVGDVGGYRKILTDSILTKIEAKHDKDAVAHQLKTIFETIDNLTSRSN
jgi:hypothetical protein